MKTIIVESEDGQEKESFKERLKEKVIERVQLKKQPGSY
jgi:hypothetical protein